MHLPAGHSLFGLFGLGDTPLRLIAAEQYRIRTPRPSPEAGGILDRAAKTVLDSVVARHFRGLGS